MRPINYYPSLEQRINFAISNSADASVLEALLAEVEHAFADAPDPEHLRTVLAKLKTAHARSRSRINWIVP